MERQGQRELEILTAIGEGRLLTQRDLSQRLGVALGLTNLYLKRLARNGLIKITEFPRKPGTRQRLQYVMTAQGFAEKTRLSYAFTSCARWTSIVGRARPCGSGWACSRMVA